MYWSAAKAGFSFIEQMVVCVSGGKRNNIAYAQKNIHKTVPFGGGSVMVK